MSRKDIKELKGGFIPTELKSPDTRGRNASTGNWQDREESLADPRWHKRPPTRGKKGYFEEKKSSQLEKPNQTLTPVRNAREILSTKKIDIGKNRISRR